MGRAPGHRSDATLCREREPNRMTPPPLDCPVCGAVLTEQTRPNASSTFLSCPKCDFRGATSSDEGSVQDPQSYAVFAVTSLDRRLAAAKLAAALGRPAKELLDVASGTRPVAEGVRALEVQRLAPLLASAGCRVRTEPAYPWSLPGDGSGGGPCKSEGLDRP